MQALFQIDLYNAGLMAKSPLRQLRESKGLSVRELARQIDEQHTNVSFWERTGTLPRSNALVPLALVLGVSVEQLLGEAKPKRVTVPGGRLRQVFERASKLPRRQQEKVAEFLEAFVERQEKAS
ncbi:MAG TPA: helix-turn-helix transcriptional regulator [Lacunisphaera sp.]|jgi:transcriptional regulator with XRE-family HTH domain|nr:helix-turn-helix transcriptional regulator [Lacunisphaera sp.]